MTLEVYMRSLLLSSIVALAAVLVGASQVAIAETSRSRAAQFATTAAQPIFETVARAQNLPSTSIFAIVSDRYGFVWLAGDRGVHRFDGYNFFNLDRDFSRPDSLESRFVFLLAESSEGIWIGNPNGTVQRLDSRTGKLSLVEVKVDGVSAQSNVRIESDALGQIWMMSDLGLLRLDRRGKIIRVAPRTFEAMGFNQDRSAVLVALPDNRVIAIDIRDPKLKTTLLALPEGISHRITAMSADSEGLWLVGGRDLWRYVWRTRSLKRAETQGALVRATEIALARDGAVWLGSAFDEGLQRYDPAHGTVSTYRNDPEDPQSLPPGLITALAVDHSNNLWIGVGTSGLRRLRLGQTALSRYRTPGTRNVCAMGEAGGRQLVMSICRRGLFVLDPQSGEMTALPATSDLPRTSNAMTSDRKGGLWITSAREGLFHWRPDATVRKFSLKLPPPIPDPTMTGVLFDERERLWVTHHRGISVLEPGASELRNVEAYEGTKPFIFDLTQDVSAGPNGSLWIGTMRGVLSFDPETRQVRRYQHDSYDETTLSDNYVLQTYTDQGGRFWVGTRAGLNRLMVDDKGRRSFRRYGLAEGLPDITIEAILSDARGQMWVATSRGIAQWDEKLDRFQSYLPSDGIPDTDLNIKSALLGADGGLYFGMLTGILRVDPQSIRIADPAPVVLSSYEIGDRVTMNLQGKRLSSVKAAYSDGRISFHIAVLGDSRRLSYRLHGMEDTWREMPYDHTITFHRPPSGSYRLQVRQLQRNGAWGAPELSLAVEISPPLWRTGWAYLAYAIVLIALLVAAVRAYTARRHGVLREQLKESHARLSVALHAARFGMWEWDGDTGEAEIDDYSRDLLAVPSGTLPVADLLNRMHPDDAERVRAQFNDALQKDDAVDFEFRLSYPSPGPQWRWIEGHGAPYRHPGKTSYVIGVYRDATQRKLELLEMEQSKQATERALTELRQSRLNLAIALESGDLGVWRCELSGLTARPSNTQRSISLDCDTNVRRIFGWPELGGVTRKNFLRAVHPEDRRRVLTGFMHAAMAGDSYTDQYRIIHPDGEIRCIAARAISMRHAGPASGTTLTGIVHDITAEETLKTELVQAAEQAQLAMKAKGHFLAMMSHEIRTPINGVIGTVALLSETMVSDEQNHLLDLCRDSAYVLLAIINDILDYSKIEAEKLDLDRVPTSPRRLIESVAESLRAQCCEKGIDLDVFIAPDVPRRVLGDRVRLRQVFANLLGNAVKFTERGGVRVHVSVSGVDKEGCHLIRFDVVDTGIGMDNRTLESLFQPFQQADAATTRRFGGTGLGLTIVRHLVSLMGGVVECDSAVSSGSRFSVIIPLETTNVEGSGKCSVFAGIQVLALCRSGDREVLLRELCADLCVKLETVDSFSRLAMPANESEAGTIRPDLLLIDKPFADDHEATSRTIRERIGGPSLPIVFIRGDMTRTASAPELKVVLVPGSPLTSLELARGFQSALGHSEYVSSIPVAKPATRSWTPTEAVANAEILVAEDNATNREVITRQLQHFGHACDIAGDGEQAWEMLQKNRSRYRLLLTDCHMPRLDGYKLTERIRIDEAVSGHPRLTIVAITANLMQNEGESWLAMGMDGFLAKPVQMGDLGDILTRMLPDSAQPIRREEVWLATSKSEFSQLSQVVGPAGIRRILDVFVKTTRADLKRWTRARRGNDHETLKQLAHKLKSGCKLIGEEETAAALEAVEWHAGTALSLEFLAKFAQEQLSSTLERVVRFKERSNSEHD
ncbi:sensory box protein [Lysobacter capsici]|uniref:ATP-binding protein n=1 Tax=Lysobacter capsici TaxID=435897 RepID=UPI00071644C3|nr:ATP-binding protein [Lysobacter capsici]ALN88579.1 sensory box protein [Lysobacter capsici]